MTFMNAPCRFFLFWLLALVPGLGQTGLVINEVVSSNVRGLPDEYEADLQNCPVPDCERWHQDLGPSVYDGEYPDWVELYNGSVEAIALAGYGLSDNASKPMKWTFPEVMLQPAAYLVVFASGKDKRENYIHTNFKLKRTGEVLILSDPQGAELDRLETGEIPIDHALARSAGDPSSWIMVASPTPEAANVGEAFVAYTDAVTASPPGGFYARLPTITLTRGDEANEIRYSTTGSTPTASSSLYSKPISALFGGDRVLKARTFRDGLPTSPVFTVSYLTGRTFTMPVLSLTMEPDDLWDEERGIYTPGQGAREGDRVANYWQEWERPVHVEFFEPDGSLGFRADAGLRMFGWGSRSDAQKSLAVMFRDRYGKGRLDYPLFPDKALTEVASFVLRAAGGDSRSNGTFFRDPFASSLLNGRNVDAQAFRPAVVYLNGEYWGIQNIREKMNEDYLASHHAVDADEVDVISRYWRRRHPVVIEGDDERFLAFEDFLTNNDFSNPDAYAEVQRLMDMDNFLEYSAAQIYFSNFDWPGNNNKNWMPRTENGRWRWLMYDLDYTLASNGNSSAGYDTLSHAMAPGGSGWPNPSWTTVMMRRLSTSETFRHAFANRIADLANTRMHPDHAVPALEAMQTLYEPEMTFHIDRWKRESDTIGSLAVWERNIGTVRTFLQQRGLNILEHVEDAFALGGREEISLSLNIEQGAMQVNSVRIDSEAWTGTYFSGVPITLTALPASGYRFSRWEGLEAAGPEITVDPAVIDTMSPIFESAPGQLNTVLFHEIHTRSGPDNDSGDWVELYNGYDQEVDVSGWHFQDSGAGNRFVMPEGTRLEPFGYLVLCQDQALFESIYPDVPCVGDFPFGIAVEGETIQLLDGEGRLINAVSFHDQAPWPVPVGENVTIGLGEPVLENGAAAAWGKAREETPGRANVVDLTPQAAVPYLTINSAGDGILLQWQDPSQQVERSPDLKTWRPVEGAGAALLIREAVREFFRLADPQEPAE